MTFTKIQSANNVRWKLEAWISAWSTTLILVDAWLFPAHGWTDYFLTLEQRNIANEVIKREIVRVTGKSSNVLTVVRWAGTCPWSDAATTQWTTSFSFDAWTDVSLNVVAEINNERQDELERLETTKLWRSPLVTSETSSATPTINTDNTDLHRITALATNITSMTTNLSGTASHWQRLVIEITGTASRTITWWASFEESTIPLPTTTVSTEKLTIGFFYNSATSKWRCLAVA